MTLRVSSLSTSRLIWRNSTRNQDFTRRCNWQKYKQSIIFLRGLKDFITVKTDIFMLESDLDYNGLLKVLDHY